jgi:hypothetical protein
MHTEKLATGEHAPRTNTEYGRPESHVRSKTGDQRPETATDEAIERLTRLPGHPPRPFDQFLAKPLSRGSWPETRSSQAV